MTSNNTNTYSVKLNFFWDDDCDQKEFNITVPDEISLDDVQTILSAAHAFLDYEDADDYYGVNGRNPESLVDYVCNENGWEYEINEPDLEMDM